MLSEDELLKRDAMRYRWLREQLKTKSTMLVAQGIFWSAGVSRKTLDKLIDQERMIERIDCTADVV